METDGGGTSEGKKKRQYFEKFKETCKEAASRVVSRGLHEFTAAKKETNISCVKTDLVLDMAARKLDNLAFMEPTTRVIMPAHHNIQPAWPALPAPKQRCLDLQSWPAPPPQYQIPFAGSAAWWARCLPGSQVSHKLNLSTIVSNLRELEKRPGFSSDSCIHFNKDYFGSLVADHISSSDNRRGSSGDMDKPDIPEIKHYDTSSEEDYLSSSEEDQMFIGPITREQYKIIRDLENNRDRNRYLLQRGLTWQQKVLTVLHMIRVQEFTEYDPKQHGRVAYRFCEFNMAFFDLDKESKVKHGPLYHHHPEFNFRQLDRSVNVISIKVAESDVPYPINIYGTVLVRDQYDYRCVYLFKRGREDPQLISSPDDILTLTGPHRALAGVGSIFFEFHLKIKGEGTIDKDFSKGLLQLRDTCQYDTLSLESYLSTVDVVCMPARFALEACIEVNILGEMSNFTGKIAAWTEKTKESKIILYDSEVAGTETKLGNDGSVSLTRHVLVVPQAECLIIDVSVYDGDNRSGCVNFSPGVEVFTCKVGLCELEFKIIWKEVKKRRPKLCDIIDGIWVLWE